MSFVDTPFVVVAFFLFLISCILAYYCFTEVFALISPMLPAPYSTQIQTDVDNSFGVFNTTFAALFIMVLIVSVILTIFVSSHPVFLALWLIINILTLVIYDMTTDILTNILAQPGVNLGIMNDAILFYTSGLPQVVVGLNLLMAVALLAKRGLER